MSSGTVDNLYNKSTLVVSFNGQQKYVPIINVVDQNFDRVGPDNVKIGDIIQESENCYIWHLPKMFHIQHLEAHPSYAHFNKSSLVDFSHFRVTQSGDRSKSYAIGIAIMEYILAKKELTLIAKLKTLDFDGSTIGNVVKYLEKKISDGTNFNQSLYEMSTKTLIIEEFAIDLLDGNTVEQVFTVLGITFCKWDSYLNYISSNNLESYFRVNFLCLNDANWSILYTKDFYANFISDKATQTFCNEISCDRPILRVKMALDTKIAEFEQMLINQIGKMGNNNAADKVFNVLNDYFTEYQGNNSAAFFQALSSMSCYHCRKIISSSQKVVLECTHIYCNKCFMDLLLRKTGNKIVLNDDEKVEIGQVCCECFFPIQEEIIKKNCKDYETYKKEAEKRAVSICKSCNFKYPKTSFNTKCKDSCDECTTEVINLLYDVCFICKQKFSKDDLKALRAFKKKCDKCGSSLPKIQGFPYKICDHYYCYKCVPSILKQNAEWNCPKGCPKKIIDQSQAYWYLKANCVECKNDFSKNNDIFMHKNCICKLCMKCMLNDEIKCSICETENTGYIKYLINEELELKNKQKKDCPICETKFDSEKIIEFINCSHIICEGCMIGNINALVDSNDIIRIFNCFDPECCVEIESSQLEYLLSPRKKNILEQADDENSTWNKLIHRKIQMDSNLIDCPKCNFAFIPDIIRTVRCLNKQCNYVFCKICKEDFHNNALSCQMEFINKRIKDMENAFPGQQISQCPNCKTPSLKDDKCNHVKCPDCKIDYCFVCSAIRSPILVHGNHYHRPQCTDYFEKGNFVDNMSEKCTECTKAGALCAQPQNLKVIGRFGEDEV